jgi:FG-GAP-like repeat
MAPSRSLRFLGAAALTWTLASCQKLSDSVRKESDTETITSAAKAVDAGRLLAAKWCINCHLLPHPSDLPREKWPLVIKWMGNYLGHINRDRDIENLIYPSLVATQETVTRSELDAILAYYLSEAPEHIAPAIPRNEALPITSLLYPEAWPGYEQAETISLVKIDAFAGRLYVGSVSDSYMRIFAHDGQLIRKINCSQNQAGDIHPFADGFDLVLMGEIGRDSQQGTVHRIVGVGKTDGALRAARLITGFHRTSGADWGDLDGDGVDDIVLAGFGDYAFGALAWFKVRPGEEGVRHDLRLGSGTLDVVIDDVDHDGDQDILAIVAQGHQEMVWFENIGDGQFTAHTLWKQRPTYGYNGFQWTDFDGDGDKDIVVASGNNMEMPDPPMKDVHGIYVYLQTAPLQFSQSIFLRMDGVTKAHASDFDRDGDLDVAAISAYPDWRSKHPASFVLFTNEGNGHFQPATISPLFSGQAITMDVGDMDGDGDSDLVLGNANWPPLLTEPLLNRAKRHIERVPPVVLLRNQTVRQ